MAKLKGAEPCFSVSVLVSDALHYSDHAMVTFRFHSVGGEFGGANCGSCVDIVWQRDEVYLDSSGDDSWLGGRRRRVTCAAAVERLAASYCSDFDVGCVAWSDPYGGDLTCRVNGLGEIALLSDVVQWIGASSISVGQDCKGLFNALLAARVSVDIRHGRSWWDAKHAWDLREAVGREYFGALARVLASPEALEVKAASLVRDAARLRRYQAERLERESARALTVDV